MQQLIFESAWDKTIAPADRNSIIELFNQTKEEQKNGIKLFSIKQNLNHRNDLLAMVLVHNFTNEVFSFRQLDATYWENGREIATHYFSFPHVTLQPKTSMPWTFIFPLSTQKEDPACKNGYVTLNV